MCRKYWEVAALNILKKQKYDSFNVKNTRYAEEDEIKSKCVECGVDDNKGFSGPVILNKGDKFYIDASESHTMVFGGSGSGKTRLEGFEMVYSTINAGHSAVISDVKEEIYKKTSGYAKEKGYNVFAFNLRNPKNSDSWNLFSEIIYLYENGYEDESFEMLAELIDILFKAEKALDDPYWDDTCVLLATGMIMALLIGEDDKKNVSLKNFLKMRNEGISKCQSGSMYNFVKRLPKQNNIYSNLNSVFSLPEKTYTCVISTFDSKLKSFIVRPDLVEILSKNEIDIEKLAFEKTLIYIITPDESRTFNNIVSIFVKSIYTRLVKIAQKLPGFALPRRVNFILDEFANMPTIPDFDNILTCARSRNIRFFLFVQSLEQLKHYYSESFGTIIGNCATVIYLYSREHELLKYLSEMCGVDKNGEYLISTSELQRFSKENGEVLVLLGREYPFITNLVDIDKYGYPQLESVKKDRSDRSDILPYKVDWDRYIDNIKEKYPSEEDDDDIDDDDIDDIDFFFDYDEN